MTLSCSNLSFFNHLSPLIPQCFGIMNLAVPDLLQETGPCNDLSVASQYTLWGVSARAGDWRWKFGFLGKCYLSPCLGSPSRRAAAEVESQLVLPQHSTLLLVEYKVMLYMELLSKKHPLNLSKKYTYDTLSCIYCTAVLLLTWRFHHINRISFPWTTIVSAPRVEFA